MNVGELKKAIENLPDDALVLLQDGDYTVLARSVHVSTEEPCVYTVFPERPDPNRSIYDQLKIRTADKAVFIN